MDLPCGFALDRRMGDDLYLDVAAAHARDAGLELAAPAVEQRDVVLRLQAQDLHMARSAVRQAQGIADGQGEVGVKAGRHGRRLSLPGNLLSNR